MVPHGPIWWVTLTSPQAHPAGMRTLSVSARAGIVNIRHEKDIDRRTVWREMVAASNDGDMFVIVALDRLGAPFRDSCARLPAYVTAASACAVWMGM